MQLDELKTWLGPALADLTPDQLDRLRAESDRIDAAHPHPDMAHLWAAAMSAATQYVLGQTTPADARQALLDARRAAAEALAASKQVAVMAVADGMTEEDAAAVIGLNRMTVRGAMGKPHRQKTDTRTYADTYRAIAAQLNTRAIIGDWYRAGIPAEIAAAWANAGYLPATALPLIAAGMTPEDAVAGDPPTALEGVARLADAGIDTTGADLDAVA